LLQAARAAGCVTMDGGAMAVGQAGGAFELFTGLEADPERMDRHFRQLLAARTGGDSPGLSTGTAEKSLSKQ
jgi:shikimate dehydrogenase